MTRSAHPVPISSHPAFKWAVSLWFALLLGLGLFVMPESVHVGIAGQLGIAGLVGVGLLARTILAGAAALLGLLIGLAIAMRIAATTEAADEDEDEGDATAIWLEDDVEPEPSPPAPAGEDAPRRPFNPREDIGEEGIAPAHGDIEAEPEEEDAAGESDASAGSALMDLWREESGEDAEADGDETTDDGPEVIEESDFEADPFVRAGEPRAGFQDDARAVWELEDDPGPDPMAFRDFGTAPVDGPEKGEPSIDGEEGTYPEPFQDPPEDDAPPRNTESLSLTELTERLAEALAACKAAPPAAVPNGSGTSAEADPVIAFLRREASRTLSPGAQRAGEEDPQSALQGALDKLSRVGKPV